MYGLDDNVVSIASAIGIDAQAVPIFNATHTDIVKPECISCEVVQTIVRFQREAGMYVETNLR